MIKIIIGVVVATIVGLVIFMAIDPSMTQSVTNSTSTVISNTVSISPDAFSVTIEGEVEKEGTYVLSDGAVMSDLIDAAGGVTSSADELAYFDEAELTKGSTYYIASKYDSSNVCSLVELTKVNINEDDAATLLTISGFTSTVANSIVSYRDENGQFNTIEDLLDVYGIGNATYRKVRNYVTLHS